MLHSRFFKTKHMKANFSVQQISDIAKKLHTYKTLFVTTRGQMFRNQVDAEESVRTLNVIINDANENVGILEMGVDMVSVEKLKIYGKNPQLFSKLFEKGYIPVSKTPVQKQHTRLREAKVTDDSKVVEDVNAALGLTNEPTKPAEK